MFLQMSAVLKSLRVLGKTFKVNLLTQNVVMSILDPLLKLDNPKYFNLRDNDVNMYLQCLLTISTLAECGLFDVKKDVFKDKNVQFVIAMSIKHGSLDNCKLALSLMRVECVSIDAISQTISDQSPDAIDANEPDQFIQNNIPFVPNHIDDINHKKIEKLISDIQKAFDDNQLQTIPANDFIELYTVENQMLKQKVELLSKKLSDLSKEVCLVFLNLIKRVKKNF